MSNPRRIEWLGTYFVPANDRKEEIARLLIEDNLLTTGMGGPLSEQVQPENLRNALDIGCGAGLWAGEAVRAYPALSIIGIDIWPDIIASAQNQAAARRKDGRLTFRVMDALEPLAFDDESFDLVNMRLGSTFLRTWDWPALLIEILRVLRPGGVIRLSEGNLAPQSTSAAFTRYFALLLSAEYNAGRLFDSSGAGLTAHLPHLLSNYGLRNVQSKVYPLIFKNGTPAGKLCYDYLRRSHTLLPFLQKWATRPHDVETIYQQLLSDIQQKSFRATWNIHTIWGSKA
jgi:ubiquinone/menaquinone biosynthesis C-methylase UbiE